MAATVKESKLDKERIITIVLTLVIPTIIISNKNDYEFVENTFIKNLSISSKHGIDLV